MKWRVRCEPGERDRAGIRLIATEEILHAIHQIEVVHHPSITIMHPADDQCVRSVLQVVALQLVRAGVVEHLVRDIVPVEEIVPQPVRVHQQVGQGLKVVVERTISDRESRSGSYVNQIRRPKGI